MEKEKRRFLDRKQRCSLILVVGEFSKNWQIMKNIWIEIYLQNRQQENGEKFFFRDTMVPQYFALPTKRQTILYKVICAICMKINFRLHSRIYVCGLLIMTLFDCKVTWKRGNNTGGHKQQLMCFCYCYPVFTFFDRRTSKKTDTSVNEKRKNNDDDVQCWTS